jgi:hypothetical protein
VVSLKKKNRKWILPYFLFSTLLIACSTPQTVSQPQMVTFFYSPATEFVLDEIYACASESFVVLQVTTESPNLYIQFGEPDFLTEYTYQIMTEELVIAVNTQSTLQTLSQPEVQNLFADPTKQVWVYSQTNEMQQVFERIAMVGRSVSSSAKVASNVNSMAEVLSADVNAIGLLPKSKILPNLRVVYSLGEFPILAITNAEPKDGLKNVLGCLQKN